MSPPNKAVPFQTDANEVLLSMLRKAADCSSLTPEERAELAILKFLALRARLRSARGESTLPDVPLHRPRDGPPERSTKMRPGRPGGLTDAPRLAINRSRP
jgi:hypothetical protein